MALKLKLDESGNVVVQDGKPVYSDDDGKELAFDASQMRDKIVELGNENKAHRLDAKNHKDRADKFGDASPEEVVSFRAILEDLGGFDGIKKLKEKSGVDVDAIKKSITEAYEGKLADAGKTIESLTLRERQLLVGSGFASSTFLAEKTVLPPDIAEATFGKFFRIENGAPVGYIGDNPIFSRENPGTPASVNEALEVIVGQYPMRDRILKATGGGSGAQQSQGSSGNGDLSKLTATELTKRQSEPAVAAFIQQKYGGKTE